MLRLSALGAAETLRTRALAVRALHDAKSPSSASGSNVSVERSEAGLGVVRLLGQKRNALSAESCRVRPSTFSSALRRLQALTDALRDANGAKDVAAVRQPRSISAVTATGCVDRGRSDLLRWPRHVAHHERGGIVRNADRRHSVSVRFVLPNHAHSAQRSRGCADRLPQAARCWRPGRCLRCFVSLATAADDRQASA